MTQQELFSKLTQLIADNPGLRVIPFVRASVVRSVSYGAEDPWWQGCWAGCGIEEICVGKECTVFKSDNSPEDALRASGRSPKEVMELSDDALWAAYAALPWERVICFYIEDKAPDHKTEASKR